MRVFAWLVVVPLAAVAACSLGLDPADFTRGTDAGSEPSTMPSPTPDDGTPAPTPPSSSEDGGDAGADAGHEEGGPTGVELLPNPSFDTGAGTCGSNWHGLAGGSVAQSNDARTGAFSCKICGNGSSWVDANLDEVTSTVAGEVYELSAWIKTAGPDTPSIGVAVEINRPGQDDIGIGKQVTAEWQQVTHTVNVLPGAEGKRLSFFLAWTSGTGCALVDDVSMIRR